MSLRLLPVFVAGAVAHSLLAIDNDRAIAADSAETDTDEETRAVLAGQWDDVTHDLERFRDIATRVCSLSPVKLAHHPFGDASVLQIGSAPATKVVRAALVNTTKAAAPAKVAANATQALAPAKPLNVKEQPKVFMGKEPSGKELKEMAQDAMLAPMLVMLKDLYKQGRDKIVDLNKEDKKSKEKFEAKLKHHNEILANLTRNAKKFHWAAGFLANQTKGENKMFTHKRIKRDLQHRQYHTMLKIKHLAMAKEKKMIQMYQATLSGTADPKAVEKSLNGGSGLGEVVFFQLAEEAREFCVSALATAKTERIEVERGL